jgi:hypothetical protein
MLGAAAVSSDLGVYRTGPEDDGGSGGCNPPCPMASQADSTATHDPAPDYTRTDLQPPE